jgi:molybdenum cofactor cytidylyltransferase
MSRNIAGILLAAGQSRRFGANKLLYPLPDGTPIGVAAARHLLSELPETTAVVDDGDGEVAGLLEREGLRLVVNRSAPAGIGTSIACAVAACRNAQGWVIALADMPYVPAILTRQIVSALQQGSDIVAPVYRHKRGHPVGFSNRHANALLQLSADQGARRVIAANRDTLTLIETAEQGVIVDIDSIDDVQTLQGTR